MPGFCEGCPVPQILSKVTEQSGLNPYWSHPEVRRTAAKLMIELSKMSDCADGPELEGLGMETDDILVSCSHPQVDIMSCLGDTLDIPGDYVGITPTVLMRIGTQAEIEDLSRQG